ncbi:helix-turn-helix domain-containing protein [Nocardia transvalensis]|uniref:helix-turn-helix domain-containing protein n=1 Tax=Nocardia transvalensis TaxID=37333 RepID=UPI000A066E33
MRWSARWWDIALSASAGSTNAEIAARRGGSRRTVEAQITNILKKLSIGSRTQIGLAVPPESRVRLSAHDQPDRRPAVSRNVNSSSVEP